MMIHALLSVRVFLQQRMALLACRVRQPEWLSSGRGQFCLVLLDKSCGCRQAATAARSSAIPTRRMRVRRAFSIRSWARFLCCLVIFVFVVVVVSGEKRRTEVETVPRRNCARNGGLKSSNECCDESAQDDDGRCKVMVARA